MSKLVQSSPSLPPSSPEDGAIELADILDVQALQAMMDAFFALEKIGMAIVDLRGQMLVSTGWQDICSKFHRIHPDTCRHCKESDLALSAGVEPGHYKLYRCQNNMWDMATPIVVGGRHVGNFFIGQFFFDDETPDVDVFRAQARRYGFDETEYLAALERVPRWSREKIERAMAFCAILAQMISEAGYRNLQLAQSLAERKRSQEELKEHHALISLFMRHSPIYTFIKEVTATESRVLIASDNFKDMIGIPGSEMSGKTMAELFPPEFAAKISADDWAVVKNGQTLNLEEDLNGRHYVTIKFPIIREGKTLLAGYTIDVTEHKRAETALRQTEEKFEKAFQTSPYAITLTQAQDGRFLDVNPAFTSIAGFTKAEALADTAIGLRLWVQAEDRQEVIADLRAGKTVANREYRFRAKDGRILICLFSAQMLQLDEGSCILSSIADITERKQGEEALRRANRALQTISRCNQLLVSSADEDSLLNGICRLLVEQGGYRMAWIGFAEADEGKSVRPVAQAGIDDGYLDAIQISWADDEHGRGPTGTAIRTGQPAIARNIPDDPAYAPWRAAAIQRGYASSIALPMRSGENCLGAFNLYAAEPAAFHPEEVQLLAELADDLAYGIEALRQRARREQAEEKLRASEERHRTILNTSPDGVVILDAKGNTLMGSPSAATLFGFDRDKDLGGLPMADFIAPEDRERAFSNLALTFQGQSHGPVEYRALRVDGSAFDMEVNANPIRDAEGKSVQLVAVIRDVSVRKQAEEKIQNLAKFPSENPSPVLRIARDGTLLYVNEAGQIQLPHWHLQVGRECPLLLREAAARAFENGSPFELELAHGQRTFSFFVAPVAAAGYVNLYGHDVTESQQAKKALQDSEAQLSNALELAHAGHWEYDFASDTFTFNDNFYRIFRTTADQVGGYRMSSAEYERRFCHPDDAALVGQEAQAAIATNDPHYHRQIEHRIRYADGTIGHIAVRFFVVKDAQGRTIKTRGVNQDITAYKQAEEILQASEARYRTFIEASSDLVFLKDEAFRYLISNEANNAFLGQSEANVIGRTDFDLMPRAVAERCRASDQTALEKGACVVAEETAGEKIYQTVKFPVPLPDGRTGVGGYVRDITARKQAEESLRASLQITAGILDSIPMRVFWKDRNLAYLGCNEAFARDAGFADPKDLVGKDDFQMGWRKQAELYRADDRQVIESGQPKLFIEEPQTTPAGKTIILLTSKIPLRDDRGEVTGVLGTYMDITEHKLAEEKLRASTERFQDIAANIPGVVYQLQTGRTGALEVSYMSSGCEALFERPVTGMDFSGLLFDHMHVGDRELFRHTLDAALRRKTHWALEFRIATPQGKTKWVRGSANSRALPGGGVLWNGVLLDITELKLAEESLRERETFQLLLMDTIPSPLFYKDRQGRYLGVNKAFETFYGLSKDHIIGKTVSDIAPPELAKTYQAKDAELFERPGMQVYEAPLQDANGGRHEVVFHKASITDAQGRVTGLIGIFHDVTKRKQAEEQMARQMDELRRWYSATLGRESRIAELKQEVNALSIRLGHPPPYASAQETGPEAAS